MTELTIPERIERLHQAADKVDEVFPETEFYNAVYDLLRKEAAVWETAYDIAVEHKQPEDLFYAPSMLTFDALAQAILDTGKIN